MAPALRDRYDLSLGQAGFLISGSLAGSVLSMVAWGLATDRFGERAVLALGLSGCGGALLLASQAPGFGSLAALLVLAGAVGDGPGAFYPPTVIARQATEWSLRKRRSSARSSP